MFFLQELGFYHWKELQNIPKGLYNPYEMSFDAINPELKAKRLSKEDKHKLKEEMKKD